MSDDEEGGTPLKKSRINKVHYGSLANEETVKNIIEGGGVGREHVEEISNINVSKEHFDLDQVHDPRKEAVMAEFERKRRARSITLPTDDIEMKMILRRLGEPICLFGEDKPDRRERLRAILSEMEEDDVYQILHKEETKQKPKLDDTTWYHEGSNLLRDARIFLEKYSLPRAKKRIERSKTNRGLPGQERAMKVQETDKWVRSVSIYGSQVGDIRPISFCQFSPDANMIATASWSGLCKLWSMPRCDLIRTYRGHNTSAGCIAFHPDSTKGIDPGLLNLASCAHDGSVLLWSLESDEPIADIEGHSERVSRLAFHPSGRFLATCCHDNSWRLFDLEVNEEILFQEGHSKPVFDIDFQCDGAVALTGGMDCYGRVWDLRTGRCIMFLEGHQKHIMTVAFAPNGYQMASGSADNSCKLWDLRMRRVIYTIPAHQNLVSKLKYDTSGNYFVTGSYDNTIKMWTQPGWQQLKKLEGHDGKVMCVDVSPDRKWIVSSSYDRTFKLWSSENS